MKGGSEVSSDENLPTAREVSGTAITVCEGCSNVNLPDTLVRIDKSEPVDLLIGPLSGILARRSICQVCQFISNAYGLRYPAAQVSDSLSTDAGVLVWLRRARDEKPWFHTLSIFSKGPSCSFVWLEFEGCQLYTDGWTCLTISPDVHNDLEHCQEIGPRLQTQHHCDSTQLDFGLIKDWLRTCIEHHTTQCGRNTLPKRRLFDLFLIDVRSRRLRKATPEDQYVALSYVWGAGRSHLYETWGWDATKEMMKADSFNISLPDILPKTIEDAIACTLGAGHQYLWVDAVCINQHDRDHLVEQIDCMGLIYRCATLTIIAWDGVDGEAGLSGISRPMEQMSQPELVTERCTLIATHLPEAAWRPGSTEWDRRAWTMQEYVLSKRRITVDRNQVSWSCHEESFHNYLPVDKSSHRYRLEKNWETSWGTCDTVNANEGTWYFSTFADILRLYSHRELRFESDALNACRGMLNHITRDTNMHWVQGLPRDHLLPSLLWRPYAMCYLQRRSEFPSWSWLGWRGRTDYTGWLYDGEGPERIIVLHDESGQEIYEMTPCPVHQAKAFAAALKKGPELTPGVIHQRLGTCHIPSADLGFEQKELWISSSVAEVKLHAVRTHGSGSAVLSDATGSFSWTGSAMGDHWTLLDKHDQPLANSLANVEENGWSKFTETDYLFRLDPEISHLISEQKNEAQLVFIKCYDAIRDSEYHNNWKTNVVTALVLISQSPGKMMRIASVALSLEDWLQTGPEPTTVCVV